MTGAKNSVLKLMAASLLAEGTTTLTDVPAILDTEIMSELLRRLGCAVDYDLPTATARITVPEMPGHEADYDLVRRMRASINVLGPLLARCGEARVARPGGDNIGSRPLDFHLAGLTKLGAEIESEHGYVIARAPGGLTGATIWLDFPSVGATENLLMAAVLAKGTTLIDNAAREPEIVDLCLMLEQMGAQIGGAGTSMLEINGVDRLSPTTHDAIPDRILAGTWAFAAAMTRGDVVVRNAHAEHIEIALDKLVTTGAQVDWATDGFRVRMDRRPKAIDAVTLPYPGLATDLLPMVLALNSIAEGAAMVTENVFESRFMFVDELARLGADVRTDGHHAVVRGRERLSGAPVRGHDIRAGAGLVVAGLVAEGITTVSDAFHVDRGYPGFAEQLRSLGADVTRERDDDLFAP
ncbi:MAG: UDP-N-acetylglucosamine 1-carboxyvinyltransferase [Actinomycetota bacterium]|nr:UDP-N-acetylglucosamine 1-carboxyvinyltransferase [Actinomycetota bacterium]MDQ1641400.1 UDP-N-acetylglucosamine 1-carboxyvinyltransferase [Actinomycetota bacterium]